MEKVEQLNYMLGQAWQEYEIEIDLRHDDSTIGPGKIRIHSVKRVLKK